MNFVWSRQKGNKWRTVQHKWLVGTWNYTCICSKGYKKTADEWFRQKCCPRPSALGNICVFRSNKSNAVLNTCSTIIYSHIFDAVLTWLWNIQVYMHFFHNLATLASTIEVTQSFEHSKSKTMSVYVTMI